jgi:hypothetical protein
MRRVIHHLPAAGGDSKTDLNIQLLKFVFTIRPTNSWKGGRGLWFINENLASRV